MIDFSKIFQQQKHEGRQLTDDEKRETKRFLLRPQAHNDIKSHVAIFVFCLGNPPSKKNVKFIERFLKDDVEDYVRSAALGCLARYGVWELKGRYNEVISQVIQEPDREEHQEFFSVAAGVATTEIFRDGNSVLRDVIRRKLACYADAFQTRISEVEQDNFKQLCTQIVSDYSQYKLDDRGVFELTLTQAMEVAKNSEDYFSGKIAETDYW